MKLKQKVSAETGKPVPKCWVIECNYTVAFCKTSEKGGMYQVLAPKRSKPFAYTQDKNEVRMIIKLHKEQQVDSD